jgi:hypothetical protein
LLHRRKEVLINMGFHVRFGIGPLLYSAPLTRRRRRTRKEQEADGTIKVILFLIFVVLVVGNLIVKAAIAHPAAALFIGCAVAGVILLGVIGVRERRRMNAKAARFERDALASVRSGSADSAVITNDASSERLINQSAGREVTPPDVPPLPAKRAESDLVAVAEAQVAEKWRELEQLDSRRIETGADLESEMQRVFQEGLDITTETFGNISDRVISEVKAGGRRARIGNRALPHVKTAMAAMEAVVASNRKSGIFEGMDKIDAVFVPLHLAYIELVDIEELGDRHARPARSEGTPPHAPSHLLPAKRAESDPVAVAAARVAEKWREWEQLDLRRIETGVDVESEMKRVFQDAFDITTEIFGNISDRVISEVKAGGRRARIGNRALPHVEDAMAAMKEVVASNRKSGILEGMDKIDAVFGPLHLAYNCLAASS